MINRCLFAASIVGMGYGVLNIATFYDLPEYCEGYYSHLPKHLDDITSSSSAVLGLNIIFLLESPIVIWLGLMQLAWFLLTRVDPIAAAEQKNNRTTFEIIAYVILAFFFAFGSIAETILLVEIAPLCNNPYWLPMTVACLNMLFTTCWGWMMIAVSIAAFAMVCVILVGPFYLAYPILLALCCHRKGYGQIEIGAKPGVHE